MQMFMQVLKVGETLIFVFLPGISFDLYPRGLLIDCAVHGSLGNLIVRSDGKVAFIDFGIVGRINPVTWKAVESLLFSLGSEDYNLMARALATMGATSQEVNIDSLANDLKEVLTKVQEIDTQVVVSRGPNGKPFCSHDVPHLCVLVSWAICGTMLSFCLVA